MSFVTYSQQASSFLLLSVFAVLILGGIDKVQFSFLSFVFQMVSFLLTNNIYSEEILLCFTILQFKSTKCKILNYMYFSRLALKTEGLDKLITP